MAILNKVAKKARIVAYSPALKVKLASRIVDASKPKYADMMSDTDVTWGIRNGEILLKKEYHTYEKTCRILQERYMFGLTVFVENGGQSIKYPKLKLPNKATFIPIFAGAEMIEVDALAERLPNIKQEENNRIFLTVGPSPFSYTAGASPERLYIYGGNVEEITKSDRKLSIKDGGVSLQPNESLVVHYTQVPTICRDDCGFKRSLDQWQAEGIDILEGVADPTPEEYELTVMEELPTLNIAAMSDLDAKQKLMEIKVKAAQE